jgi:hypothetical protein
MKRHLYTQEERNYIELMYPDHYAQEIADHLDLPIKKI